MNKFPVILMLVAIIVLVLVTVTVSFGMTWNDKPVLCMERSIAMDTTYRKQETLIFKAMQTTKIKSKEGLQDEMQVIPFSFYYNPATKTYTMFEYHAKDNLYCILSPGVKID